MTNYLAMEMSDKEDHDGGLSGQGDVLLQTRPKTKKPSLYKVLLLNDDFTPMEFVIQILQKVFGKSVDEAQNIMWMVHTQGLGVCGVYTYEIAETKATQVVDLARKNQHPLQCTLEKE